MKWLHLLYGFSRWFWWRLKKDWREHERRVESCRS